MHTFETNKIFCAHFWGKHEFNITLEANMISIHNTELYVIGEIRVGINKLWVTLLYFFVQIVTLLDWKNNQNGTQINLLIIIDTRKIQVRSENFSKCALLSFIIPRVRLPSEVNIDYLIRSKPELKIWSNDMHTYMILLLVLNIKSTWIFWKKILKVK